MTPDPDQQRAEELTADWQPLETVPLKTLIAVRFPSGGVSLAWFMNPIADLIWDVSVGRPTHWKPADQDARRAEELVRSISDDQHEWGCQLVVEHCEHCQRSIVKIADALRQARDEGREESRVSHETQANS